MSDYIFIARFSISTKVLYLQHCLVVTWLVPRETAAMSGRYAYTIQPCIISRHFMQSHILRVHVCLVVTCHLHFWQNDRDLLRAAVRTRGWNGYRNKSQHRNLTPDKKILPSLHVGTRTHDVSVTSPALCPMNYPRSTSCRYTYNIYFLKCFARIC